MTEIVTEIPDRTRQRCAAVRSRLTIEAFGPPAAGGSRYSRPSRPIRKLRRLGSCAILPSSDQAIGPFNGASEPANCAPFNRSNGMRTAATVIGQADARSSRVKSRGLDPRPADLVDQQQRVRRAQARRPGRLPSANASLAFRGSPGARPKRGLGARVADPEHGLDRGGDPAGIGQPMGIERKRGLHQRMPELVFDLRQAPAAVQCIRGV
jgi:hypothetical protein